MITGQSTSRCDPKPLSFESAGGALPTPAGGAFVRIPEERGPLTRQLTDS